MCVLKSLMSQVLSNTSVKVFLGTETWGGGEGGLCPPKFLFGVGATALAPLLLCL